MDENPWLDIRRAPVLTGKRVYRLAEWPSWYPGTDEFRQAIEQRCAELAKPGRTFVGVPAISIIEPEKYWEAKMIADRADQLFASLPAANRAEFRNDTLRFLAGLRDARVRQALSEAGVMLFEGEGDERLVGSRPDQKTEATEAKEDTT